MALSEQTLTATVLVRDVNSDQTHNLVVHVAHSVTIKQPLLKQHTMHDVSHHWNNNYAESRELAWNHNTLCMDT